MASPKFYSNGYWKVYVHINKINGKRYVGITSQKPEYRWNNGRAYKRNPHFNSAILKYGWDNFEHTVLYDFLSEEEAKRIEIELIAKWNTQDNRYGYNIAAGGESSSGYILSEEVRKRISEAHKGHYVSEETKQKHREKCVFTRPDVVQKSLEARQKKVNAYTLDGEYVGTYNSIVEAAKDLNLTNSQRQHISDCCKGNRKSSGNYRWEYA